jgi:hypothetical protein
VVTPTDTNATIEEQLGEVFPVGSVQKLYNEEQSAVSLEVRAPHGDGFEYLHLSPASRRGYDKGTQCLGK